jgi:uncharacterized membrane protein YfcA
MIFFVYICIGLISGFLAGIFGVGGGMVIVPVLVVTFSLIGVSELVLTHLAVGTSLMAIAFTSLSSIKEHHKYGLIDWKLVRFLSIGMMIGSAVGVYFVIDVNGRFLQYLMGIFAWLIAAKMVLKWSPKVTRNGLHSLFGQSISGGIIGFGSSWFGIGGGSFTVPYLTWQKYPMIQAVSIAAACGFPIALAGSFSNMVIGFEHDGLPEWSVGFVYWPAVLGIIITSIPSAKLGARVAHKLNPELLKLLFSALLVLVGIKFIFF